MKSGIKGHNGGTNYANWYIFMICSLASKHQMDPQVIHDTWSSKSKALMIAYYQVTYEEEKRESERKTPSTPSMPRR